MNIELHIEELVLHGVAPGDRHAVGGAVQAELTRLFAESGAPRGLAAGGSVGRIDAGTVNLTNGAGADGLGTGVARAVHGGLNR